MPKKQSSEIAEPVVDRHDDDPALARQSRPVDPGAAAGATKEGAAVYPEQDRSAAAQIGAPNIQIEAVLRSDGVWRIIVVLRSGKNERKRVDVLNGNGPCRSC